MTDARTFPHPCPKCGKKLDAATSISRPEATPKPGDLSICIYCATVLQFDDELAPQTATFDTLKSMTPEELAVLFNAQMRIMEINADMRNPTPRH